MKSPHSYKLALMFGVLALGYTSTSFGAGILYSQLSGTGLTTSTATRPFVLDDVSFAAGSTAVRQELSGLSFGLGVLPNTTAQSAAAFLDFYDTVNVASTGSVVSDYLGGFGGTLTITANTSTTTTSARQFNFTNLNTLATPIFFTDNNIGVVLTLTDSAGQFYSTVLTPLLSVPGTPTVGTSTPGVYRDTNADGTFQSTEFNAAAGNLYLSLTTINAPVPEPSTFILTGLGGISILLGVNRLRRRG